MSRKVNGKNITVYLPYELIDKIKEKAKKQNRSISNYIANTLDKAIDKKD